MQIYECRSCESIFEFNSAATGGRCPDCLKYDLQLPLDLESVPNIEFVDHCLQNHRSDSIFNYDRMDIL